MTAGPGLYDDQATRVREAADATAVVLIVYAGERGSGFSVQAIEGPDGMAFLARLPATLRNVAAQIDRDLAEGLTS